MTAVDASRARPVLPLIAMHDGLMALAAVLTVPGRDERYTERGMLFPIVAGIISLSLKMWWASNDGGKGMEGMGYLHNV